ncbi:MAG: triose-phosphate isomerase [Pirellulaceae bacterium]
MRKPVVAGNWKMNTSRAEAKSLATTIASAELSGSSEVVLCPPFVYLTDVIDAVAGSDVGVGGQNTYFEANGAFTGEVSIPMLLDCGAKYVILGHSERRQLFGETDSLVNQKLVSALATPIVPIVCVGETLEEREAGKTSEVVQRQMEGAFSGVSEDKAALVIVAYEPVWAIGTGKTATPDQAQKVHLDLRNWLEKRYNATLSQSIRILYGGSVKGSNAAELMSQPDIDGALVGGASLKADEFLQIIAAAK